MADDELESRIRDFERAWRRGTPPALADSLDRPPALADEVRHRLLIELACIDLEFRWRDGLRGDASLEGYAASYPELGGFDGLPLELIEQEYRVRSQWGDRPRHSDFLARFAARRGPVGEVLRRVDRELQEEAASAHTTVPPALCGPRPETAVEPLPDVPSVSHADLSLRRMIGAGRMGKIYLARQHSSGRDVAVKFLRKSFLDQPGVVGRFLGEARIVAQLDHPNIAAFYGLGRTPGGSYFLVFELIGGPSLDRLIRIALPSVEEAVRYTVETCMALEHAHSCGVVHCDLKPANLLRDRAGGLRVTDFGLGRSLVGPTPWAAEVEGTAPFMAPEQASPRWGAIDVRTDVYGVGAVLYALLTGRPPWPGRRLPDILADVLSARLVTPPIRLRCDLPAAVNEACCTCLSKAPSNRYQSVREVRSVLAGIAAGC